MLGLLGYPGDSLVAAHRLLTAAAPLPAKHGLRAQGLSTAALERGLSSRGARAWLLRDA